VNSLTPQKSPNICACPSLSKCSFNSNPSFPQYTRPINLPKLPPLCPSSSSTNDSEPMGHLDSVNPFASLYPLSPRSGVLISDNRTLILLTSSVSPSTMAVTVPVKQSACPWHSVEEEDTCFPSLLSPLLPFSSLSFSRISALSYSSSSFPLLPAHSSL
jgi:hypothetical protein